MNETIGCSWCMIIFNNWGEYSYHICTAQNRNEHDNIYDKELAEAYQEFLQELSVNK